MDRECGLPVNYNEAHRLARLGAEQGNTIAISHLGVLFGNGWGGVQDDEVACKWYWQAAALGEETAEDNLLEHARAGRATAIASVRELGLGPL